MVIEDLLMLYKELQKRIAQFRTYNLNNNPRLYWSNWIIDEIW